MLDWTKEINHLINQLKEKRVQLTRAQAELTTRQEILEGTPEWADYQDALEYLNQIKEQVWKVDQELRTAALATYQQDGNKNPANGVKVIIARALAYDIQTAINWAALSAQGLLKLDKRKFEQHARNVAETVPLSFVEITEQPTVRISKDL